LSRLSGLEKIVVLTGAGVSAESGMGTFRDKGGIWTRHRLEDVATPEGFARDPVLVHGFYNARRSALHGAEPNAAHRALAQLEATVEARGGRFLLVTQNVDDLHEKAGSSNVIHMHGELTSVLCEACGERTRWEGDLSTASTCPVCGQKAKLRPDVVWFGEIPYRMDEIQDVLSQCDLFVSIGTSGEVYPAAGFVLMARSMGAHTVELNLEPSQNARDFTEGRYGPASEVVAEWVNDVFGACPETRRS
jgi:NAD-dependent deacetylase